MSLPAAVLWDLDGTLIDTEPYWIACEHELVASYGGRWTDADATSIVGFDLLRAAEVIRSRGNVPLRPPEIVDRLLDGVIAKLRENITWRPGARELLAALRLRGVPCGLVTMSWKSLTDVVVPALPPGSFDTVITGDMVMNGKPHPEAYRRAAEELHVDPLSCVAIEDSPTGIASAEAAGCVVVAVQNMVPIPAAPHRVVLDTLRGITPEHLGDWVESTPPPEHVTAETEPVALFEDPALEMSELDRPAPQRTPHRAAAALRFTRNGGAGLRQLLTGRGRILGALAAVLLLLLGGIWYFAVRDSGPKYDPGAFNVHAWAPDWELDNSAPVFGDRANLFHQMSPFWYQTTGVTTVELTESVNSDEKREATSDFIDDVRSRGVPLVPSITDGTSSGVMAAMLNDPAERAAHVDALGSFAADNDFDGLDINYETFAFGDDKDTWATTRPGWVAFITELAARLHSDGRVLAVSIPPIYDNGRTDDSGWWVYDYAGIAPHVDAIRIMVYDFSVGTPGPIAPLSYVEDSINGAIDAIGGPDKLVLGIPLYGRNWVTNVDGECPDHADDGTLAQSMARITEILGTRDITSPPAFDEETGEVTFLYEITYTTDATACTQTREVHYLGDEGVRQRMQISIDRGLLGVALFAFGYENDVVWTDIDAINATLETTVPDGETAPPSTTGVPTTSDAPTTAAAAPAPTTAAGAPSTTAAPTTVAPTTSIAPTTT